MFKERLFSMQRSSTKRKSFWIPFLVVFLLLFFILGVGTISLASAQNMNENLNTVAETSGLPQVDLVTFIGNLVRVFLGIIGIVLVLLIMYGGFIWMTAEGDPGKVDKAKKILTNAIIGLIIILASFAITTFIMGWLTGSSGSSTGTTTGGPDDWYRSNIGKGPIESVYPAPNQKDVSIDTLIIVTFKEPVTSSTIIRADGMINTNTVQICEASSAGTCIASSTYNVNYFASTTVTSTPDNRTYVFTPNRNLGPADGKDRYFKVWLGSGITRLGKTDSIFGVGGQYSWAFQTNGKIDLNSPYIVASNLYPYADDVRDTYDNIKTAATGVVTSTFATNISKVNKPARITGLTDKYYLGQPLIVEMTPIGSVDLGGFKAYVRSPSGPSVATNTPPTGAAIEFTVSSNGTYIIFKDDNAKNYLGANFKTDGVCAGMSRCLPLDPRTFNSVELNGLIIESRESDSPSSNLGAAFPKGSSWKFTVYPSTLGDRFIVQDGNKVYKFMFVDNNETRSAIIIPTLQNGQKVNDSYIPVYAGNGAVSSTQNLASAINDSPANLIVSAEAKANGGEGNNPAVIIRARKSGSGSDSIEVRRQSEGAVDVVANLTGGQNISYGRHKSASTTDPEDPANNSKFQITFSKAINPISISGNVIVKSDIDNNGTMETVPASTTFANQYKTIVLTGTIPCGVNSCGQQIYCWTTTTPGMLPTSTPFAVEIKAATLKTCSTDNDSWCAGGGAGEDGSFGGTCSAGSRCQKVVGAQTIYYPKASNSSSGISDVANNSLNGNFNYYYNDFYKQNLGLSEGKSVSTTGGSGASSPFSLSANTDSWVVLSGAGSGSRGPWSSSTSATTVGGDDFKWSFYLSSMIDLQSPLINNIEPYGDQSYGLEEDQTAMDPVRVSFDRIMAIDTLKPGWGYDSNQSTATWTQRFLVLQTITSGANPVGYWIGSDGLDSGGDGWADYTQARIMHNNFDQSIQYGPLAGSGIQSITQNCFLPGNGPKYAGDNIYASSQSNTSGQPATSSNNCNYQDNGTNDTEGCVSDKNIPAPSRVTSTNPASYAHMKCTDVAGAKICDKDKNDPKKVCMVLYYDKEVTSTHKFGSWIITKDFASSIGGKTGCCFGTCVNASTSNIINN